MLTKIFKNLYLEKGMIKGVSLEEDYGEYSDDHSYEVTIYFNNYFKCYLFKDNKVAKEFHNKILNYIK